MKIRSKLLVVFLIVTIFPIVITFLCITVILKQQTTAFEKELLGGVVTITALEGKERIKFIPYYAWDNRDAGKMKVWVDYRD